MSEATQSDDGTFRLATGEELVLPGDALPEQQTQTGPLTRLWRSSQPAPSARPGRPARPARPSFRDRRAAKRLRARKVRRLVRHIEPWSVLKISLIFYFCLWIITLIAGVLLWNMAVSSGTIDNVENFIAELFALDSFEFNGEQIFRATAVGGLVLVVAGAGFTVLMAVLFNLISDITGGVRLTVVEEETARPRPRRTRPRRGVRPTPAPELAPVQAPEGMVRVPEVGAGVDPGEVAPDPDQLESTVTAGTAPEPDRGSLLEKLEVATRAAAARAEEQVGVASGTDGPSPRSSTSETQPGAEGGPVDPDAEVATAPPDR
jgi:hypothetical protein